MNNLSITNSQRQVEIVAVVCTGAGKFIFMDVLQWKLAFIMTAIIAWSAYVFYRRKQRPGILAYWGFRHDNFRAALRMTLPFGVMAIIACVAIGYVRGSLNITWHIIPILLLYPIWGTIQQFLVIALVAGNLKDFQGRKIPTAIILLVTALLFGWLHYPFYWLVAGTFLLAFFYGYIFLRVRNVFVMGLFHGWLGAIFFYTVVGRDPFMEVFGKLLQ